MLFDPFLWAADEGSCFFAIAVIVVPLFCLKTLHRRGAWLAICGLVLFQATEIASLFYNFPAMQCGIGYLAWWVE